MLDTNSFAARHREPAEGPADAAVHSKHGTHGKHFGDSAGHACMNEHIKLPPKGIVFSLLVFSFLSFLYECAHVLYIDGVGVSSASGLVGSINVNQKL